MGQLYPEIDERNAEWIRRQRVFFVATAPLAGEGHVNLSPEGLESFAIPAWAERKGAEGLRAYVAEHGARSIDGLPGLERRLAPTGDRA